jgi:FlaG/FlaF family flagellin (archaellin)
LRKFGVWSRDKRALSPIFATVLLASIIIIFGSVAYYYASNITSTATNQYVSTLSDSQQAMAERIGFENVVYTPPQTSPTPTNAGLDIYLINCGSANNVQINSIFLYGANRIISGGSPYSGTQILPLKTIDEHTLITGNSLNVGKEGYITVEMLAGSSLTPGSMYTIHLITKSGSYFDYAFTP